MGYEYGHLRRYPYSGYQGRSPYPLHRVLERLCRRRYEDLPRGMRTADLHRDPDHPRGQEHEPLRQEDPLLPRRLQGHRTHSRTLFPDPLQPGYHRRYRKVLRYRQGNCYRDPRALIGDLYQQRINLCYLTIA